MPAETDDNFEEQAAQYFNQALGDDAPDESEEPEESEEEGEEESPETASPAQTPPPSSEQFLLPDGRVVTAQQALDYLNFVNFLQTNPDKAQAIGRVLSGEVDTVQARDRQTPTSPETLEDEDVDPRLKAYEERLAKVEELAATQAQTATQTLINRAYNDFQTKHNLSDPEMQQIYTVGERLQVLPAFLSGVDPVTGAPSNPDPLNAFERTFEMALNVLPDIKSKVESHTREQEQKTRQRKRKLSSLAGSSGSQSRSPKEVSPEDRRSEYVNAVAQAMGMDKE